ncbi:Uncharacterized protein APZ42_001433 [Daphnia magna]|uniref:Uncharacterized protein n=2 Tax=Daphnia magna TaxID=35525 RepID=A0A164IZN8_9CRUS|nr:hypothetical protein OUZ56_017035 [Daphnia magna]KZS01799.1 Uncharacterized protein APZ42_001433 [Daphnia magna]
MEKEIVAMVAREHILMLEKRQMAAELIVKQGIIDLQAAKLLQVRTEVAEQANKVKESEEKFRKVLDSLNKRCSALVQVCEKSHLLPKKVGETSTEETSKRIRHGKHQRSSAYIVITSACIVITSACIVITSD